MLRIISKTIKEEIELTDVIINFFQNLFHNDILTIITIGIIPIIELRGAIPVAVGLGMEWYEALLYCWLGSSIMCPILLLLLKPVLNFMKKWKIFRSLAEAVESMFTDKAEKVSKKAESIADAKKAERRKMLGVYAFVALPLPLTGVWTGSAVAVFLGLPFFKSLIMVLLGNLTAGIIMTALSVFLKEYIDIILTVFLVIVLLVLIFYIVTLVMKMRKAKKNGNTSDSIENADEDSGAVVLSDRMESEENADIAIAEENNVKDDVGGDSGESDDDGK